MPTYTFRCRKHGIYEFNIGMDDPRPTKCMEVKTVKAGGDYGTEICGRPLERVFDVPATIYRAGGFQATDNRLEPTEDELYD